MMKHKMVGFVFLVWVLSMVSVSCTHRALSSDEKRQDVYHRPRGL